MPHLFECLPIQVAHCGATKTYFLAQITLIAFYNKHFRSRDNKHYTNKTPRSFVTVDYYRATVHFQCQTELLEFNFPLGKLY